MEPPRDGKLQHEIARRPLSSRPFEVGTAAYALVVLGMLTLSSANGWWFLLAEIMTLPIGIGWFIGGVLIVAAVADELGRAGVPLMYAAFAGSAVMNAVLLRGVFRFARQRCEYRSRSGPHRSDRTA